MLHLVLVCPGKGAKKEEKKEPKKKEEKKPQPEKKKEEKKEEAGDDLDFPSKFLKYFSEQLLMKFPEMEFLNGSI
jgi:hypothetical protein